MGGIVDTAINIITNPGGSAGGFYRKVLDLVGGKRNSASGSSSYQADQDNTLNANISTRGATIPILWGRRKIGGNIIYYANYNASNHTCDVVIALAGSDFVNNNQNSTLSVSTSVLKWWKDKEPQKSTDSLRFHNESNNQTIDPLFLSPHLVASKTAAQGGLNYPGVLFFALQGLSVSGYLQSYSFELQSKNQAPGTGVNAPQRAGGVLADIILYDILTNTKYGLGIDPLKLRRKTTKSNLVLQNDFYEFQYTTGNDTTAFRSPSIVIASNFPNHVGVYVYAEFFIF